MATSIIQSESVPVTAFTVSAGSSAKVTFSASATRGVLWILSPNAARQGAFLVSATSTQVIFTEIVKGSSVSVSATDTVLTVTNNASSGNLACYFERFVPGDFTIT